VNLPPAGINQATFARDGDGLWVSADAAGEFRELVRLDPVSGITESLTAHASWDVEMFAASDDGEWLAYSLNERGFSRLAIINVKHGVELDLPALPGARINQMSFQSGTTALGLTLSDPGAPANVFRLDPTRQEPRFEQWTASEVGGLDMAEFVGATSVQFPTFDKVEGNPRLLQALLYPRPGSGPHPVLIDIHGGPEGQAMPNFDPAVQLFSQQLGFAILRPNVRGSSGFGRSFLQLDNGRLREDSVRDIGALLDWIKTRPELDQNRVALIGGSYGGYMVLASLAAYPERLMGGIDRVGISNFVSFLENTSDYRRALRRAEYGDETDPGMRQFLKEISPTGQAARLTKPLLVFQGRNDPRVPVSESRQMVAEIERAGGEVWYLEAQDEGHGIRRKDNQKIYLAVVSYFLSELLQRPTR
jgi:dipeptidyl aminopeptidase/acylaminoacyl peptidase